MGYNNDPLDSFQKTRSENHKQQIRQRLSGLDMLTPDHKVHDRLVTPKDEPLTRVGENGRRLRDAVMKPAERLVHGIASRERELKTKAKIDRKTPASAGASYKPESERDSVEWIEGQYLSAQGLSDALSRGQILSPPVKAPDALERFLERRAEKKHTQAVEQAAKLLAGDDPEPIGLQRKREGQRYRETLGASSEGLKPSRW